MIITLPDVLILKFYKLSSSALNNTIRDIEFWLINLRQFNQKKKVPRSQKFKLSQKYKKKILTKYRNNNENKNLLLSLHLKYTIFVL